MMGNVILYDAHQPCALQPSYKKSPIPEDEARHITNQSE